MSGAKLALFGIVCAAQLWAAGGAIVRYERTLADGEAYRFECAPVDPEDPFRGRYVALGFAAADVPLPLPGDERAARVFARLGRDARGFATFTALLAEPPAEGDYLVVEAWEGFSRDPERTPRTNLQLPFTRYFLPERVAPEVERDFAAALRRGGGRAYAVVRVRDGIGVIESLVVNGEVVGGES